jgi:hypothetical protein
MKNALIPALAAVLLASSIESAHQTVAAASSQRPAYLDPDQPLDRRVDDLLGRLTLSEKN